jgi:hypothetical protein
MRFVLWQLHIVPSKPQSSIPLHLQSRILFLHAGSGLLDVHLAQLGLGTTGDLLGAQGHELLLEIIKLLLEVLLVLAPELLASDLAGRLSNPPVSTSSSIRNCARGRIYHCERLSVCGWSLVVVESRGCLRSRRSAESSQASQPVWAFRSTCQGRADFFRRRG